MKIASCALAGRTGHEAGRALLAALYREETGLELPPIAIAAGGKPYFPGSDWHFSIYDKSETLLLIEDAASKPKTEILKTEAKKVIGLPNVTVLLTYKLTGKKQKVQCGWNKTQDMQEIKIVKVEIK